VSVGAVLLVVGAYLGGSLPWGYWAGRLAGRDVRREGSGNTGATNLWRVLGPRFGVPVLLLDMAKGFVPALLGSILFGPGVGVLGGAAALVGHTFPVFLGFGGGKGVATGTGAVLALTPLLTLPMMALFVAVLWLTRYVSLSSMTACTTYTLACLATGQPWPITAFAALGTLAIVYRHRTNIARLRAGTEAKTKTFGRGARGAAT
jgi:glycerol-3-phosphate acyltransferase PlsY